ncbi:MAG TPA: response regulator transcription factor [Bacteroidetes bacterium]|nr:response regulator transcription factor [Bacteroidota bacterium]
MKVLIIEDESRAANALERLLGKVAPEMKVVGKLETVRDAIAFLQSGLALDLVFSDIQLADGLSLEIFKVVQPPCPIIFTTAFDQYAVEAFRSNGIDYLLKPISEERMLEALAKVKRLSPEISLADILALTRPQPQQTYKSRFMIKVGDELKSIPVAEVRAFFSLEKATFLLTLQGRKYVMDQTLDQVAEVLNPQAFFRINRKYIIGFDAYSHIYSWSNSRLRLVIEGVQDHEIVVARDRVAGFKEWLDR